jgi:hypothetical protein
MSSCAWMGLADEAREHVSDFGISRLNATRYSPRMTILSDLDAFTREHDGCVSPRATT